MEGSRVVPECDRETLWESLREKQAAQLDRLKKSEPKYELVLSFKIWDYSCSTQLLGSDPSLFCEIFFD